MATNGYGQGKQPGNGGKADAKLATAANCSANNIANTILRTIVFEPFS